MPYLEAFRVVLRFGKSVLHTINTTGSYWAAYLRFESGKSNGFVRLSSEPNNLNEDESLPETAGGGAARAASQIWSDTARTETPEKYIVCRIGETKNYQFFGSKPAEWV